MKAPRGSRGVALLSPNLGARWGWMVHAIPRLLYRPSLGRALVLIGGSWMVPQCQSGWFLAKTKSLVFTGDQAIDHPAHS